ncbi:hypothetical protein BDL97_11G037700 [Sphagnum fallax]|nr:hypothetical protein BDL97_11G037700 [Sphagnum fallax]
MCMHVIPVRFGLFLEVKLPCSVVCNVDVFGLFHFCSSTMHRRKTDGNDFCEVRIIPSRSPKGTWKILEV